MRRRLRWMDSETNGQTDNDKQHHSYHTWTDIDTAGQPTNRLNLLLTHSLTVVHTYAMTHTYKNGSQVIVLAVITKETLQAPQSHNVWLALTRGQGSECIEFNVPLDMAFWRRAFPHNQLRTREWVHRVRCPTWRGILETSLSTQSVTTKLTKTHTKTLTQRQKLADPSSTSHTQKPKPKPKPRGPS